MMAPEKRWKIKALFWVGRDRICSPFLTQGEIKQKPRHSRNKFTQPFIQAHIEEHIQAPRHCSLWAEFTGDPAQRASSAENVSIWWRHHETSHVVILEVNSVEVSHVHCTSLHFGVSQSCLSAWWMTWPPRGEGVGVMLSNKKWLKVYQWLKRSCCIPVPPTARKLGS